MENQINLENLSVKQLRQRMFVKRSSCLFDQSEYTFNDNTPDQIEALPGFRTWETFSETWDVLWVGLDPRTLKWIPGRHHSPVRKLITPLRIVGLDERTKRMEVPFDARPSIDELEVPYKTPQFESDEDRAISDALSGKVVVDETDEEKAKRMLQSNISELSEQLALLQDMANKLK